MRKKRYFIGLLMTYIALILIYTTIASVIFFHISNVGSQRDNYKTSEFFLKQLTQKNDYKLQIVFNLFNQLKIDNDFIQYVEEKGYNNYYAAKTFLQLKKDASVFSDFDGSIAILKQGVSMVITPYGTLPKDIFYNYMGFDDKTKELLTKTIDAGQPSKFQLMVNHLNASIEGNQFSAITYVRLEEVQPNNYVMVFFTFNEDSFLPEPYGSISAFVIADDKNIVMRSFQEPEENIKSIFTNDIVEKIKSGQDVSKELKKFGYTICVYNSSLLKDWYTISIINIKKVQTNIRYMIMTTFLLYVILIILGLPVAYVIARKMYLPISELKKVFYGFHGNQSGNEYDDLDFIKRTGLEIKETITKQETLLKTKFLHDWLYGIISMDDFNKGIEVHDLKEYVQQVVVCVVKFVIPYDGIGNLSYEKFSHIKNQLFLEFTQNLEKYLSFECIELDEKQYAFIISISKGIDIKKILSGAITGIAEDQEIRLIVGLGDSVSSIYYAKESFNNALRVLDCYIASSSKVIYTAKDMENIENVSYYYPLDMEHSLIQAVILGNKEEAMYLLNRIMDENTNRNISRDIMNEFIFAFVATIKRIVYLLNTSTKNVFDEGAVIYLELKMCEDMIQIKEKLNHVFESILDKLNVEEKESDQQQLEQKMFAFIGENYHKDVSLSDMAAHFGLSFGYMSRIFKKITGQTFKDYLNIYRIEKAKQFLDEQPDVTINALAEQLGYTNANSFIRTFKRYVGYSPTQYLKLQQKA